MAVIMAVLLIIILAVSLPLAVLSLFSSSKKNWKSKPAVSVSCDSDSDGRRRLPPSPAGLPLVGHLHLLGRLPHRSLRSLAASHGPVMLLRLGRVRAVVVSSAAAAEEAMKSRDLAFSGRPRLLMAERLLYGCRDVGFAPYGEYWRQARRISVLHLLSARRIRSFRRVREHEVAALLDRLRSSSSANGVVNLSDALICYSKGVISRAAFGGGDGDDYYAGDGGERLRRVLADFEELIAAAPVQEMVAPWLWWVDALTGLEAKTRRTFQALDGFLDRVIADHRRKNRRRRGCPPACPPYHDDDDDDEDQISREDFVDVLLDVKEMDKEAGMQLDTDSIKAIIMDVFAAGTDTAYTVLSWAMAELVNNPHAMRRLQDELRSSSVAGGRGNKAQASSVLVLITEEEEEEEEDHDHLHGGNGNGNGMAYLKAVVSETMRLHAPAPFLIPRETVEDTELQGHHVPAGTRVMVNAWAIGRDPATWGHDAEEFVPERWFAADDDDAMDYSKKMGQDFRFVPFGAGRRGCPGAGFAAKTMELALANMLYHFDWDHRPTNTCVDMTEEYGLSLRLKKPLLLTAKPWIPPAHQ